MPKGISPILSLDLLKVLAEMGHGDEIVVADGNFPAASIAQKLVRLDRHPIPGILGGVLGLFPLDRYVAKPVSLMAVRLGNMIQPVICEEYRKAIRGSGEPFTDFEYEERFAFYERAGKAYAVAATGESAVYSNIILKNGVVI